MEDFDVVGSMGAAWNEAEQLRNVGMASNLLDSIGVLQELRNGNHVNRFILLSHLQDGFKDRLVCWVFEVILGDGVFLTEFQDSGGG